MNEYAVFWTTTAQRDLEELIDYIAMDSVDIATSLYEKIKKAARSPEAFPDQGRIIPELQRQNIFKYREVIIDPWRLMYKKEQEIIYIMAVIDGRRNIEDILMQRQLR